MKRYFVVYIMIWANEIHISRLVKDAQLGQDSSDAQNLEHLNLEPSF